MKFKTGYKYTTYLLGLILMIGMASISTTNKVYATEPTTEYNQQDPEAYKEYIKQQQYETDKKLGLSQASPVTHAKKFKGYSKIKGIDVSVFQADINWKKVKKAGIDFAIIRVGYRGYVNGALLPDANYATNIEGALKAGVDVGVYVYSQAITEAEAMEEANFAIDLVKDYDINLPIVMDFEYASNSQGLTGRLYNADLSIEEATNVCNAFCETVEAAGYTGMVYANADLLTLDVNADEIASDYPIWLAHYTNKTTYTGDYSYWQYTSRGSVSGIEGYVDRNYRYVKKPTKVKELSYTDAAYTDHTLTWNKVTGAYGYYIYEYDPDFEEYTRIGSTKGANNTSFLCDERETDYEYQYAVRAIYKLHDGNKLGTMSSILTVPPAPLAVGHFAVTATDTTTAQLSWTTYPEINSHGVYRSEDGTNYTLIAELPTGATGYTDTNLTPGALYFYQVRMGSYGSLGQMDYISDANTPNKYVTMPLPAPTNFKNTSYKTTSINLAWDAVANAQGYHLYYYNKNKANYELLAQIEPNKSAYTVTDLEAGRAYEFYICAVIQNARGGHNGLPSETLFTCTKAKAPADFAAKDNSATKINLSWAATPEATGYEIYRKADDEYKKIADVTENTYTDTKRKAGKGYSYKIRSYQTIGDKTYYGTFSKVYTTSTTPEKVTKLKGTAKKTSITLKWKASKGATKYIIYQYNSKTKTYKKIGSTKAKKFTIKKLSRNKTYKFKVVAYRKYKKVAYPSKGSTIKIKTKR